MIVVYLKIVNNVLTVVGAWKVREFGAYIYLHLEEGGATGGLKAT